MIHTYLSVDKVEISFRITFHRSNRFRFQPFRLPLLLLGFYVLEFAIAIWRAREPNPDRKDEDIDNDRRLVGAQQPDTVLPG